MRKVLFNFFFTAGKKVIWFVFGRKTIKFLIFQDQYVIIGNHRDSWTLGAMDPTSGTAVILELARTLMTMKNNGSWKPKRSVLFMSWGAEEYGKFEI